MRIIHALGWYFPDSLGGTEIYVNSLARELHKIGISSQICAPTSESSPGSYRYDDVAVFRYPIPAKQSGSQIRGMNPHAGFDCFSNWLKQQNANVYHQHSWTTGCGLHHLRAAKKSGLKTVTTVHVPGNVCIQGTMMFQGKRPCDGLITTRRCGACRLRVRGVPGLLSSMISVVPAKLGKIVSESCHGSLCSPLSSTYLVKQHKNDLEEMFSLSDRIIAVSGWLYDALLLNGVPEYKLMLCRQGVDDDIILPVARKRRDNKVLRVGYLGRWSPIKGLDLIVEAVKSLPKHVSLALEIYGVTDTGADIDYKKKITEKINGEDRIIIKDSVERENISDVFARIDVLAVPSRCMETGPLVVLEAESMGVPILGSRLGGISELVKDGVNGRLVDSQTAKAWASAFIEWVENPPDFNLDDLRHGVRTMQQVAHEMKDMYVSL